jgi:hypothetical protein
LNSQGAESWAHNGIPVAYDSVYDSSPVLARSGDGNLCVVWEKYISDTVGGLVAQELSPTGARLWPESGVIISHTNCYSNDHVVIPDRAGGLFAAWSSYVDWLSNLSQVYATHLGGDGVPVADPYWVRGVGGQISDPTNQSQQGPAITSDGYGGFVAAWTDYRASTCDYRQAVYAQHFADAAAANDHDVALPKAYALSQNYPNPFNPTTEIAFALPKSGLTTLKVYDLLGREVTTLVNRSLQAGDHRLSFDASSLASGIYFYRLESGSFSATKKMILLK